MNRYARTACLALVLACRSSAVAATDARSQDTAPQVVITPAGVTDELVLRDGTRAYGRVERVDAGVVTFITTTGAAIQVQAAEIVSVHPVEGRVVAGQFRRADPNPTRLFFGPTGRSLKQGVGWMSLKNFRKDIRIELLDEQGTPVIAFTVVRAWPSEYVALGPLDADAVATAVETLTLRHEGILRDAGVREPQET